VRERRVGCRRVERRSSDFDQITRDKDTANYQNIIEKIT